MNRMDVRRWYRSPDVQYLTRRSLVAMSIVLIWWSALALAQNSDSSTNSTKPFSIRATHLLGFENVPSNASGTLSIQGEALQFQKDGQAPVALKISTVQNVFLGEQDKQVGGLPMSLGKTAAPFGGGRVVSLFAHKKYDTLALEYVDADGAIHGAIFQLGKGQSEVLKNELAAKGAHIGQSNEEPGAQAAGEVRNETR